MMVKKIGLAVLALVVVAAIVGLTLGPRWIEQSTNLIDDQAPIPVTDEARALHGSLTIVDLHSDTLLWDRDMTEQAAYGHMDLPRLQDGNVALQVFSSVTKAPRGQNYESNDGDSDNITTLVVAQLQPIATWSSLLERSLFHGRKLDRAVADAGDALTRVATAGEVAELMEQRRAGSDRIGALLSIEGLHNLEGDPANLDRLYDAGFRMAGLTHFFDNDLAGSMHGRTKGGLTAKGRTVVARMEELGMVVDIAHCSSTCVADILKMARRPVVSSHGGVQATCPVNRNLSDAQIRAVAANGGIIGIGYWDGAICDTSPRAAAKAMKHIRDLVGIEHVALGSDYDGATTVRFDTSQLVQITQALLDEGFTEGEIRAVMGDNAIRVLSAGLVPLAEARR